jgi:Mg2+-importing ATPase
MVSNTATVIRRDPSEDAAPIFEQYYGVHLHVKDAKRIELPIKLLVPGDVIVLSAGDMIPADCRVLTAKDLFVAQAAMTGESMPVEKLAIQRLASAINPLELDNILFMGTNMVMVHSKKSWSAAATPPTISISTPSARKTSRLRQPWRLPLSMATSWMRW